MWHCLLDLNSGHVFSGREVLTTASALTLPFKFVKMFLVLALRGYATNKENFNANNLYPWRSIQPIQLVLLLYSGYKNTQTQQCCATCSHHVQKISSLQHAKKGISLVDFSIGLVENSILNMPDGQVKFFEEFKL